MSPQLRPMEFGEIYTSTFTLIRRTLPHFLLWLVVLVGAYALVANASMNVIDLSAEAARHGAMVKDASPELQRQYMMPVVQASLVIAGAELLFGLLVLFAQVAITLASWDVLNDQPAPLGSVLGRAIRRPFWATLLQTIIIGVIGLLVFFLVAILAVPVTGMELAQAMQVAIIIFSLLMIYPIVATSLRIQKTAIEARGPWHGIIASIALVKGNWFRVFIMVFSLIIGFGALSVIIGSLAGTSVWMPGGNGGDPQAAIQAAIAAQANMSMGSMMAQGTIMVLAALLISYVLTPIYVDLRARRGEFEEFEEGGEGRDDFEISA